MHVFGTFQPENFLTLSNFDAFEADAFKFLVYYQVFMHKTGFPSAVFTLRCRKRPLIKEAFSIEFATLLCNAKYGHVQKQVFNALCTFYCSKRARSTIQ